MKRKKLHKGHSKKLFSKTASKLNIRNVLNRPMRGGIRL